MKAQRGWATIIGIVLLLVGIVGFFMDSPLFGLAGTNTSHNLVHLVTGAIFLWAGLSRKAPAMAVNKWLGVIYILVAILGFLGLLAFLNVGGGMDFDNWLHLVIGVVSAGFGWFAR